ncbi:MAG: tetratricopeptide repeat protein [Chitinophagales bacterium]
MDENKKHINAENWQRFFNHRMAEKEKSSFLDEVEQDDFAREAMEGFDSIGDNEKSQLLIKKIQKQVRNTEFKSQSNKRKIFPIIYKVGAIAASFTLLIGSVFFFVDTFSTNNETLAEASVEEEKLESTFEIIDLKDEPIETENTEDIAVLLAEMDGVAIADEEILEENSNSSIDLGKDDRIILAVDNIAVPGNQDTERAYETIVTNGYFAPEDDAEIVEMEEEVEYGSVAPSPATITTSESLDIAKKEKVNNEQDLFNDFNISQGGIGNSATDFYQIGLSTYQSGDYTNSIYYFEQSIKNGYNTIESNYYAGLSNYYLGNQNTAIKHFDNVIANNATFSSSAKWYKAELLIKKGKTKQAKNIYQDLIDSNSTFKDQAQEILDSL